MTNKNICPEDNLRVLLAVQDIPDESTVSRRTGEYTYTLRHNLTFWTLDHKKEVAVEGFFLVDDKGTTNQVQPGTLLHWHITAEDLVDTLRDSWETSQ